MPTNLPAIATLTGAAVTEANFKTQLAAVLAALREMGDPLAAMAGAHNLSLAFSVASNALTVALKQRDGTNPDATNVVAVPMRNSAAGTGDFNVRLITGALSLTISSGSTLGHTSGSPGFVYWYLIDNAGTLELAASTTFLGESGIVSTTAEGGAGAADSAEVVYSTTARTNVPFRCIARTRDTQTTAGTWTALPAAVDLWPWDERVQRQGTDIASASTLDLVGLDGDLVDVTGTTTITAVKLQPGREVTVRFTGALTLTHGASLVLPGAANVITAAGDYVTFRGYASGVVRVSSFQPGSAGSIKSGSFTRDISLATGTQAVTGVGFQPRGLILIAAQVTASNKMSVGVTAGPSAGGVIYDNNPASAGTFGAVATSQVLLVHGGTPDQYTGNVSAMDADGFTMSWTKTGSPTGTVTVFYLAWR